MDYKWALFNCYVRVAEVLFGSFNGDFTTKDGDISEKWWLIVGGYASLDILGTMIIYELGIQFLTNKDSTRTEGEITVLVT